MSTLQTLHFRFSVRLVVFSLSLFCATSINAQTTRTLSSTERRIDEFNRQSEKVARDELNREMHGRKPTKEELRIAAARKAEIKKGFDELQAAYNDIVTKLHAKEAPSDAFVFEVTDQISRGANRLRSNLTFPERVANATASVEPEPASLRVLCLKIYAFLTNPIFETPDVIDVRETERARDTLDSIIRASESLHKKSEFGR